MDDKTNSQINADDDHWSLDPDTTNQDEHLCADLVGGLMRSQPAVGGD